MAIYRANKAERKAIKQTFVNEKDEKINELYNINALAIYGRIVDNSIMLSIKPSFAAINGFCSISK